MTTEFAFFDKHGEYLLGCSGKEFMIIFWKNSSEAFKKTLVPKLKIDGLSENWQAWDIKEEIRQMKEDEDEKNEKTV